MERRCGIARRARVGGWMLLLAGLLPACHTPEAPPPPGVHAYVSTDSITVGDRFRLTLVAVHGAAHAPLFPLPASEDTLFGDLDVLDVVATGSRLAGPPGQRTRIDSIVYEVTTFALDTARVPPLPVLFSADDTLSMASAPLTLPVASLLTGDEDDIRDEPLLTAFPGRPLWPFVLLALAVVLLVGLLLYYLHHRRRQPEPVEAPPEPVPPVSPYDAALARLRMLESTADLGVLEQVKPFYVELADVLRTYLEDRLGVPALERTTRELKHELEGRTVRHKLPGGAPQRVHGILELADLVKFADVKPPPAQSRNTLDETRKTIDVIEVKLRQIALDRERAAPRVYAEPAPDPVA